MCMLAIETDRATTVNYMGARVCVVFYTVVDHSSVVIRTSDKTLAYSVYRELYARALKAE